MKAVFLHFWGPLLVGLMLLTGCKSTPSNVDYDTETNFSQFSFYQFVDSKEEQAAELDDLSKDRIEQAISSELSKKSLNATDDAADLQVSFYTTEEQKENKSSFSIGFGGTNYGGNSSTGVGVGTTIPIDRGYDVYTQITIDFYHQGKMIWRGFDGFTAEPDMTPEQRQVEVNSVVSKILSQYPPK
ncbi:DUF4136 domain-containing protein [Thalassotalea sp. Y01]|uniref:DUF4136 domain-containing protein n=1 Tax=Thalassotalea sp. Y01 TaxID=2729613 RepID=UPI00145CED0D|nr:DUF4136 domain-containing protein [Thalassotalea sp. Y01]NMP17871.1 DUF4136 domain-containing protein [Thalassotalea sp. Y01]